MNMAFNFQNHCDPCRQLSKTKCDVKVHVLEYHTIRDYECNKRGHIYTEGFKHTWHTMLHQAMEKCDECFSKVTT